MRVLALASALVIAPQAGHTQSEQQIAGMKADCAAEWAGDFAMQEYCLNRSLSAFVEMYRNVYQAARSDDENRILYKCLEDWRSPNGQNWPMVQYCYGRQLAAYKRLNN